MAQTEAAAALAVNAEANVAEKCCDLGYLRSGLSKDELRHSVDVLDACLKHARQHSPNDAEELVSLSHRLVVALALLLPDEQRSILRLTSADEDDTKRVLLFHHILVQSARYVQNSPVADEEVKLECAGAEAEANYLLDELAESFKYTEVIPVFMAMQASNIAVSIIDRGKEIFHSDRSILEPIQACVYDILHHINDSIVNGVDAETFKQGHLPLRHALGVVIKTLTKKTPNLGDGLSLLVSLIVVMNFATPACASYVCQNSDEFCKADLGNSCVDAWRKSFPTLVDKDAGLVNSTHRGPNGAVGGIGYIDRLFFVSKSNKSKNGEVQDMDEVLKDGRVDKLDVHLVFACNLVAKVVYIKLDGKGKRPSILATGAPVRDNLFQRPDAMISPYAEFPGCLPHSEMWMKKHFMLACYGADELQEMSQTMNLSLSVLDDVTASINSDAAERWVLLHEMTPEEHAAMRALVAEAMAANSKKGGEEAALLFVLAKAMEKENWNGNALSDEMKKVLAHFLRKDDYNGEDGMDKLLVSMKGARVFRSLSPLLAAFRETATKEKIVDVISVKVRDLLLPEPRALFDRLSRETYSGNDALLLEKLENKRVGLAACLSMASLLSALLSAFRETATKEGIVDVISVEVRDLLPPESRAQFDRLSRETYNGNDALLLEKLENKRVGLAACRCLSSLLSAFRETATKEEIVDVISVETLRLLPPESRAQFDRLAKEQYGGNDALLLEKLEGRHVGWAACCCLSSLLSAFCETAKKEEIVDVISEGTLRKLPDERKAAFQQLSREQYDSNDARLLQMLKNKCDGLARGRERAAKNRKKKGKPRPKKAFSERLAALQAFELEHGHMNPQLEDDKSLADFCSSVRQSAKNPGGKDGTMVMNEQRVAALNAVGFDWRLEEGESQPVPSSFAVAEPLLVEDSKPAAKSMALRCDAQGGFTAEEVAAVAAAAAAAMGQQQPQLRDGPAVMYQAPTVPMQLLVPQALVWPMASITGDAPIGVEQQNLPLRPEKKGRLEETPSLGRRAKMTVDCGQRVQGTIIGVTELAFGKFSLALLLDDGTVKHDVSFPADDISLLKSCNGDPLSVNNTDYLSQWMGFDVNDARAIEEIAQLMAVTASLFK